MPRFPVAGITKLSELTIDADLAMGAHNITLDAGQTVDGKDVSAISEVLPKFAIPWTGTIATIPSGYVLCDGANETPNLTDRFVIHADADAAGTRNVGDTGGAMTHTLTSGEIPSHRHTFYWNDVVESGAENYVLVYSGLVCDPMYNAYLNTCNCMALVGGGAAHQNMSKFYALAFIMKT